MENIRPVFFSSFGEEEVASHKGFDSQILNMIPQRYVFLLPYSWQFYEWYLFDGAEISPITSWYMVKCHIIYDMVLAPSQLVVSEPSHRILISPELTARCAS